MGVDSELAIHARKIARVILRVDQDAPNQSAITADPRPLRFTADLLPYAVAADPRRLRFAVDGVARRHLRERSRERQMLHFSTESCGGGTG